VEEEPPESQQLPEADSKAEEQAKGTAGAAVFKAEETVSVAPLPGSALALPENSNVTR
jgi:hypothetical protein